MNTNPYAETTTDNLQDKNLVQLNQELAKFNPIKKLDLLPAILDYKTLLATQLPPRKKILPWLPEGGLMMVAAERGIGKTYFALSLAYAIANGQSFMKFAVTEPAGVLYIDGEMALADIRERLMAIATHPPIASLHILSHEWFYNQFERDLYITDPQVQDALLTQLNKDASLRVVIFDNLSSLTQLREDKGDDWRTNMLPFMIACRRRGVAIVLVHHCNKTGEQRGTGAREDHLDTSIKLTRVAGDMSYEGCRFKVNFTKARGVYGKEIEPFIATLIHQDNQVTWDISAIEESTRDRFIQLVQSSGTTGVTVTEAAQLLQVSKGLISRLKKECEEEGVLQYSSGKRPMKIAENWVPKT